MLKQIRRTVCIAALTGASLADADPGKNVLTMQPFELFSGTLNLEYERAVQPWVGLFAGLNFLFYRGALPVEYHRAYAVGPEIGARFYPFERAPSGLWLGPYLGFSSVRNEVNGAAVDSLGYGLGAMAGYNLFLGPFDLSAGLGTGWLDYSSNPAGTGRVGLLGFVPRLRLAFGFGF